MRLQEGTRRAPGDRPLLLGADQQGGSQLQGKDPGAGNRRPRVLGRSGPGFLQAAG